MKRVALKRKSWMKRGGPLKKGSRGLRKTRLKPRSTKAASWTRRYIAQHRSDHATQRDALDGELRDKDSMDRHHPFGRKKHYILIYCYLTPACHEWIHAHGTLAREQGWLQPPYESRPYDPDWTRPWKPGSLINERLLDQNA